MIAATTRLTSEPLGALALTAALAAVAWAWSRGRAAGFAAAGIAVGLACLVRADVLLAALVLAPAVGLLHARRTTWRAGAAAGCATLLGVLAVVGPWSAFASRRDAISCPSPTAVRRRSSSAPTCPGHGTIFGLKHALAREALRVHPSIRHKADLPPEREGLPRRRRRPPPAAVARRRDLGRAAPQPARLPARPARRLRADARRQDVADVGLPVPRHLPPRERDDALAASRARHARARWGRSPG